MSKTIEMILAEVEAFNESIREVLNAKKINASGEASRSLRVEHDYDSVKSIGIFYLEFLDTGRGPGKRPPIQKLIQWAKIKFGASDEESVKIAFAVANNIAKLGTLIFRNNQKGIELSKKIVTLRENLRVAIKESTVLEIEQRLDKFKNIARKQKYQI